MCNSLKTGGKLLIFTYPKNTPYAAILERVVDAYFPELKDQCACSTMISPLDYKQALEQGGLNLELFQLEDTIFHYNSPSDFRNYVKGWLGCYLPIFGEQQEFFLDKLCEQVRIDGYCDTFNKIHIPHQTLKIVGQKV